LIPPAGSTASTWGEAAEALARLGRVITYVEGAGHAAPFDATANFVQLIAAALNPQQLLTPAR
jgi:hypothetical protein